MRDSLDAVLLIAVRLYFRIQKKSRYYIKHRLFKTSEVTIS